jgi:novobiocin biosynthesis protein NovU/D-mycarose 3-C-methyltransferase
MRAVGVDPAKNLSEAANKQGHTTINAYFGKDSVEQILREHGPAHAISGNNVFAHIDDIHDVLRNVTRLLDPKGLFVIEFPYLAVMLDEMLFDMIYHEHLSYIGVTPLAFVLEKFGLEIFDINLVPSHGGSLRVFIQKKNGPHAVTDAPARYMEKEKKEGLLGTARYKEFAAKVMQVRSDFRALALAAKGRGQRLSGYGAPAKCSTLVNFYGLGTGEIAYVVDDNPLKQNLLVPGMKIPIVPSARLNEDPTDYVVIFAWNFAREILKKIGGLEDRGIKFLVPLPMPGGGANSFEIRAKQPDLSQTR